MSKYYEVYSWTWWYHRFGTDSTERMWVVEDDNQEQGTVVITLDKIKKTWW